jgi:hypothetical protein
LHCTMCQALDEVDLCDFSYTGSRLFSIHAVLMGL